MADGTENTEEGVRTEREDIFSKSVRAGKRTYFFDVKTTRRNDYYLTLTESKKRFNRDGRFYFEKHKIFLYKEDFDKFVDGLTETIAYIKANAPEMLDPEEVLETLPVTAQAEVTEVPEDKEVANETETTKVTEFNTEEKVDESIAENFSNVEFEDLEDNNKN